MAQLIVKLLQSRANWHDQTEREPVQWKRTEAWGVAKSSLIIYKLMLRTNTNKNFVILYYTMPRQRRTTPQRSQSRSAHTAAYPSSRQQSQHPPATAAHPNTQSQSQPRQPGLFGQMASTAAGVAVGSTIGHTIGAGITGLFGGSSQAPVDQYQDQQLSAQQQQTNYQEQAKHCDADAMNFTRCLEDNGGNMQICDYYLQQLKACQEASRQY